MTKGLQHKNPEKNHTLRCSDFVQSVARSRKFSYSEIYETLASENRSENSPEKRKNCPLQCSYFQHLACNSRGPKMAVNIENVRWSGKLCGLYGFA